MSEQHSKTMPESGAQYVPLGPDPRQPWSSRLLLTFSTYRGLSVFACVITVVCLTIAISLLVYFSVKKEHSKAHDIDHITTVSFGPFMNATTTTVPQSDQTVTTNTSTLCPKSTAAPEMNISTTGAQTREPTTTVTTTAAPKVNISTTGAQTQEPPKTVNTTAAPEVNISTTGAQTPEPPKTISTTAAPEENTPTIGTHTQEPPMALNTTATLKVNVSTTREPTTKVTTTATPEVSTPTVATDRITPSSTGRAATVNVTTFPASMNNSPIIDTHVNGASVESATVSNESKIVIETLREIAHDIIGNL